MNGPVHVVSYICTHGFTVGWPYYHFTCDHKCHFSIYKFVGSIQYIKCYRYYITYLKKYTYKCWEHKWLLRYTLIKFNGKSGKARGITLEAPEGYMKYANISYIQFIFPCDNVLINKYWYTLMGASTFICKSPLPNLMIFKSSFHLLNKNR